MNPKIQLTEEDFKFLNKALEAYPDASMAGDVMFDILEATLIRDKSPEEMETKRIKREEAQKEKKRQLTESARIVQAKLYLLKHQILNTETTPGDVIQS